MGDSKSNDQELPCAGQISGNQKGINHDDMVTAVAALDRLNEPPLGYLLQRITVALRSEAAVLLAALGLTFPQYVCLRMLSVWPGCSNAELARNVSVSPQSMNLVVRGLEEAGLIVRPATVATGRALPAQLTKSGERTLLRAITAVEAAEDRLMTTLTTSQRQAFYDTLIALSSYSHDSPITHRKGSIRGG